MAQSYDITINIKTSPNRVDATQRAMYTLLSVLENALGYGLELVDLAYNQGTGLIRVRLTAPLPPEEVESFAGLIVAV